MEGMLLNVLGIVFALGFLIHGVASGEIIVHGYEHGQLRRAYRDEEPTKYWFYVGFYAVIVVVLSVISLAMW